MSRIGLLIFGIAVLAASGAGATTAETDGRSLFSGVHNASFWTLTHFADGPDDAQAILHFEGQSLSLDVPCYRRSWAYRYEAGTMTFTNPWGWKSRCNQAAPPIVRSFDPAISAVKMPRLEGEKLSLLDAGGRIVLELKRLRATGLENRKWYISAFFNGTSLVPVDGNPANPPLPHITFMHGSVSGSPGCGGFVGEYSLSGQQVTISAGVFLAGFCHESETAVSGDIHSALSGGRVVERDGNRFVLRDHQGRIQIVLTPWEEIQPEAP